MFIFVIECLKRCEKLSGVPIKFFVVDLRDKKAVEEIFDKFTFHSVIHFAGLKAVGESCQLPLLYYQNNISGTICNVVSTLGYELSSF